MSTATTRETPGSGIVMPTSWFAISIVILLCEMNRNCVSPRHVLHHLAEAVGVRIVERRVDLVQQAERRRVQLEEREHERNRRERLLATGKQVDRRVALAGRLRDHLHARIEDLLAGQHELRLAAAEQHREKLREVLVDGVERLLQQLPRSRDRSGEWPFRAWSSPRSDRPPARSRYSCARVACASSSSAARLTAPSSAIAPCRRSISRRQRARVAPRLQRVGQRANVGFRFGQLLGELLLGQRRRLFLELHLLDLRARADRASARR